MDQSKLKDQIRRHYADIAEHGACGCGECCSPAAETGFVPESSLLETQFPAEADLGLGCGSPTRAANLAPGEHVLDLGSGAGADVFRAAAAVGPTGHVLGVDMTTEMVERARHIAAGKGYTNVEFRLGDIENLPVKSEAVDAVLSNCVLNLVPDKPRAFAEMQRVLRPGGRFVVSDIVTRGELPESTRRDAELWAACLGGAIDENDYLQGLRQAGFEDVTVLESRSYEAPQAGGTFVSITVRGRKP
jgi:SAM-dependent methyltransferase